MRKTIILVCSCILWVACKNVADSDKYMVRMSTPSNACRVQLKTASPIGEDHLGPFSTKDEAVKAMCKDIDPDMSDEDKCWVTVPDDACKQ
jgi:hypothetical protein